jgi:hypothetical protein
MDILAYRFLAYSMELISLVYDAICFSRAFGDASTLNFANSSPCTQP